MIHNPNRHSHSFVTWLPLQEKAKPEKGQTSLSASYAYFGALFK